MGLKDKLFNKTIFLDTAPFIYFIEGHSRYQNILLEIFKANESGKIIFQTSTLTLVEVLVQPMRLNQLGLAIQYEKILTTSAHIDIYDIDREISKRAAKLRADYNLKTPDAIQIASGLENNADFFLTNDLNLKRVTEIKILTLGEL